MFHTGNVYPRGTFATVTSFFVHRIVYLRLRPIKISKKSCFSYTYVCFIAKLQTNEKRLRNNGRKTRDSILGNSILSPVAVNVVGMRVTELIMLA